MLRDVKHASKEEIGIYEEERRLFYVGITRAKNNLFLFKTHEPSIFIKQLFHKKHLEQQAKQKAINKSVKVSLKAGKIIGLKAGLDEAKYDEFVCSLAEGVKVWHKRYGEGVVSVKGDRDVIIVFEEGLKAFDLKVLFEQKLIQLES